MQAASPGHFSALLDWSHYWGIESTTASSSFLSSSLFVVSLDVCIAEQEMFWEGHSGLRPFSYTQHCYFPCLFLEISSNMSSRQILGQSWRAVYPLGSNIIKSTHFLNANIPNSTHAEAAGRLHHTWRKTTKMLLLDHKVIKCGCVAQCWAIWSHAVCHRGN